MISVRTFTAWLIADGEHDPEAERRMIRIAWVIATVFCAAIWGVAAGLAWLATWR